MKNTILFTLLFSLFSLFGQTTKIQNFEFIPIHHATFVIQTEDFNILVDPGYGTLEKLKHLPAPNFILITHEHGDHLNIDIINSIKEENTVLIGPKTVIEKLGFGKVINNMETLTYEKLGIEAIPMYNTTPERAKFHVKGVGNGYVITLFGERIYIAGDTEDIPEMRALKNIDHAFICINLPYTMSVEQAASAILEMKPKNVYPYHYRNADKTFSPVRTTLKDLVSKDSGIVIQYLEWYEE